MYADPLFPEVVSSYKERYKTGIRESFLSYCRRRHVGYKSITQWMRRHGMSIASLRMEALLEQGSFPCGEALQVEVLDELLSSCPPAGVVRKDATPDADSLLKGVTATFPDGLVINIRQTTAVALTKLIDCYNRLNVRPDVQPY
jgi:hypothetical protein